MEKSQIEPGFIISGYPGKPCVEVIYDTAPTTLMNVNAFPPAQGFYVQACADHLTLLRHSAALVEDEIRVDAANLIRSLGFCGIGDAVALRPQIVHAGGGYLTGLYASLSSAKSALDCFSIVMVQLIDPGNKNEKLQGFHKGTEEGVESNGRRLWAWLEKTAPRFPQKEQLIALLRARSMEWITEAVRFRDDISHRGRIKGYKGSSFTLDRPVAECRPEHVSAPIMPNGASVSAYCSALVARTFAFIFDCVALLPRVDLHLLKNPLGKAAS